MGILSRLMGRRAVTGAPERRDFDPSNYAALLGSGTTASGQYVSPRLSENLATCLACVNAISSTLASLPPLVFVRSSGVGRTEAAGHPVARLTRQPNQHQSWPDLIEQLVASVLTSGNALATIEHDGAGRVTALNPVPWPSCSPVLLPSGRLAFDVSSIRSIGGGTGTVRRYFADECFYLKDRSDDGLIGRSRISRAPDVLGNAQALQDFAGNAWRNQLTPSGVLEVDKSLPQATFDRIATMMKAHEGTSNARRMLILDNAVKWKSLSVSPEDAEVLASRKFSVEELCRLFQVPPPIVQSYEYNTFTNSQQAALWFAQFSLTPWARKIEAEFKRSVFGPSSPYELEIDLSGLMRGDYPARWAAYSIARDKEILSVNEIREAEGYAPVAAP